uniref:Response regulatory domain-containing protein n=1 Tax=Ditylenchus dipsaci TaxID=166011 RepID=A0A915DRJ5_9BILA
MGDRTHDVVAVQALVEIDRGGEAGDEGVDGLTEAAAPGLIGLSVLMDSLIAGPAARRTGGYTVLEPSATNGEEALTLIDSLKPDVVLLDIAMPGLDGLQVAARLCEREAPPAVVFCTGDDQYSAGGIQGQYPQPCRQTCSPPQALRDALRKADKPNRAQLAALTRPANEAVARRSHISAAPQRYRADSVGPGGLLHCRPQVRDLAPRRWGSTARRAAQGAGRRVGDRFVTYSPQCLGCPGTHRTPSAHAPGPLPTVPQRPERRCLTVSRRHVAGVRKMMQAL